jgi:hypothetical protein
MRAVLKALTSGANKVLTLSRAFPSTSVQVSSQVEVFAGDDLTIEICSTTFGAATNGGEAHGGWQFSPNRDFTRDGIR